MNTEEKNKFLGKLYDNLVTKEIISELDKPKDLKTKVERLQRYSDKLQRVQDKAYDNERYLKMVKELYYNRYIIKEEDIPESYLKSLERQYLNEGHGHINLVNPQNSKDKSLKTEHINNIIRQENEK